METLVENYVPNLMIFRTLRGGALIFRKWVFGLDRSLQASNVVCSDAIRCRIMYIRHLLPERLVRALSKHMGYLFPGCCWSFVSVSDNNFSFILLHGRCVVQLRNA